MNQIILHTTINAPRERCFELSTSIDLHKISATKTQEKAINGITTGLIKLDETVTWEAKHFGIWQQLEIKITEFEKPRFFVDEMVKGSFKFMKHKHEFREIDESTMMTDTFEFASPFGVIGKIVDKIFLKKYLTQFLKERNKAIKEFAESEKWKQILK